MLRGINVGGHSKVNMAELKEIYESIGYENVQTYLQSGNVIFQSLSTNPLDIIKEIEIKIEETIGFKIGVFIRTAAEMHQVIGKNPFTKKDAAKLHVTFLSESPKKIPLNAIEAAKSREEAFSITGREVYLFCPNGYGWTKLSNNFLEKKLQVGATTRNWNSVNALASLAGKH